MMTLELREYLEAEYKHAYEAIMRGEIEHLCFSCGKVIDGVMGVNNMGPFVIYNHAVCVLPEDQVQELKEVLDNVQHQK